MVYFKVFLTVVLMSLINYADCKPSADNNNPDGFLNSLTGSTSKESIDACLNEAGMTIEEFHEHQKYDQPLTEKHLCFIKCMFTCVGKLDENGALNIAAIKSSLSDKKKDQVNTSIACLEKLDKITTCAAVDEVVKCLPKPPRKDN